MLEQDSGKLLRAIFSTYGWDYPLYIQLTSAAEFDHVRIVDNPQNTFDPTVNAIHVERWERFGNSIMQLVNLSALCQKYKIPAVYFENEHYIFDISKMSLTVGAPFIKSKICDLPRTRGVILSGKFFFDAPYHLFSGQERQEWMDRHVLPLLPVDFTSGHPHVTPGSITAHFRAGDIFSTSIHADYGQPPLAYYKLALNSSGATSVIVVYEDKGNPTIDRFLEYAAQTGRNVVTQSSDLRSDLALLFNSRELISGRGSFLWAVHALSRKLEKFWYFHWPFDNSPFARREVRVNCIMDVRGQYEKEMLSKNWRNTPAQRELMLTYPSDALAVRAVNS
jgi:hypothetical protein